MLLRTYENSHHFSSLVPPVLYCHAEMYWFCRRNKIVQVYSGQDIFCAIEHINCVMTLSTKEQVFTYSTVVGKQGLFNFLYFSVTNLFIFSEATNIFLVL
jgi:hypothetical protein